MNRTVSLLMALALLLLAALPAAAQTTGGPGTPNNYSTWTPSQDQLDNSLEPLAPQGPEVQNHHINAGPGYLRPGESLNCGQVSLYGRSYEYVNNRVVVVTNNSDYTVPFWSSDGCGWSNTVDFTQAVLVHFVQGCDNNGCGGILWINLKGSQITATPLKLEDYCQTGFNAFYCPYTNQQNKGQMAPPGWFSFN